MLTLRTSSSAVYQPLITKLIYSLAANRSGFTHGITDQCIICGDVETISCSGCELLRRQLRGRGTRVGTYFGFGWSRLLMSVVRSGRAVGCCKSLALVVIWSPLTQIMLYTEYPYILETAK
jgi:hypothetical protein